MLIGVDFGDIARKVDPYRVELMEKNGCFEAVDGAVGCRRMMRFTHANFHGIFMAGLEVIGGCCPLAAVSCSLHLCEWSAATGAAIALVDVLDR